VRQKVTAHGDEFEKRIKTLTAALPSEDAATAALIAERLRSFPADTADPTAGREVFKKHCAACHRIGEEGSLVGPQLDGVGIRGLERILEDVLDPNRNVDVAFRVETLALDDGRVLTGLFRREEGATLVFADQKGKEFTVPAESIAQRKRSALSLMPANFGEALTESELHNLLADLLRQRAAVERSE
jgi:putative heme-binding domain-containing protein